MRTRLFLCLALVLLLSTSSQAEQWSSPVRESWVRQENDPQRLTDFVLISPAVGCQIVVSKDENSAVQQAASFLASDLQKVASTRPAIVSEPSDPNVPKIHLVTLGNFTPPDWMDVSNLKDQWESFHIQSHGHDLWLVGSNFRGTAFAAYCLSERLGIDPLYIWTGYTPTHHNPLVVKSIDYYKAPPTFRFRGLFHDDEDILPRPFDDTGYPSRHGSVPTEWYARFFETALRLQLNMVAPYTRVQRRHEVQKLASDWGLFYTSHHYDILLSNPYGMTRYGLADLRHAGTDWNWTTNRQGMLNYWQAGVEENKDIHCIYPVGMRGTDDVPYTFPKGTTDVQKAQMFSEAIASQVQLAKDRLPKDEQPLFHFTLYTEMLDRYRAGTLQVPPEVMIIWTDDNDGSMRALPDPAHLSPWKHGVYYHLAYLGKQVKQSMHIVPPQRIAEQFKRITDAGATEYLLVNVSELREFLMETKMIADIAQDAKAALPDPSADANAARFVNWWSTEYFGPRASPTAAQCYQRFYQLFDSYDKLWSGSDHVHSLLASLSNRFTQKPWKKPPATMRAELTARNAALTELIKQIDQASAQMSWPQQQYFFEHLTLGVLMDYRPTQAALKLLDALESPDDAAAWKLCVEARTPLEQLEVELLRAERPPFEGWYRKTWIRRETRPWNPHRPYEELRIFLSTQGHSKLADPELPHAR